MKTKLRIAFFVAAATISLFACKKNNNSTTTSSDASLSHFYVYRQDSMTSISKIAFTIDNDNLLIYNEDSLPFQAPIEALIPYVYGTYVKTTVINDSITYTGSDTIDFRKPVTLKTTATDGESTLTYTVTVNVHQIDPELYSWSQVSAAIFNDIEAIQQKTVMLANKLYHFAKTNSAIYLYTSNDGKNWARQEVTGLPTTTDISYIICVHDSLLVAESGAIYSSISPESWNKATDAASVSHLLFSLNDKLYATGETDGVSHIFTIDSVCNDLGVLPTNFPVSDYALIVDLEPSGKERAYLIGGKQADGTLLATVWSSYDGTYWVNLAKDKEWFTPRYGASAIQYAKGLLMIGGANETGVCDSTQWYSPDYGLTWRTCNDKELLPENFVPRYNASVVIDDERFVYIIGGQTNDATLSDVFVGRKNSEKPGFKD